MILSSDNGQHISHICSRFSTQHWIVIGNCTMCWQNVIHTKNRCYCFAFHDGPPFWWMRFSECHNHFSFLMVKSPLVSIINFKIQVSDSFIYGQITKTLQWNCIALTISFHFMANDRNVLFFRPTHIKQLQILSHCHTEFNALKYANNNCTHKL